MVDVKFIYLRHLSDVKALKRALKGRYRLRVGKCRIFFSLDQPGNVVVTDVDNSR